MIIKSICYFKTRGRLRVKKEEDRVQRCEGNEEWSGVKKVD